MLTRSRKMKRSEKASIEGFPLTLVLIIVVAAVVLGILVYWLTSVGDQKTIGTVYFTIPQTTTESLSSIFLAPANLEIEAGGPNNLYRYADGGTQFESLRVHVYDDDDNPVDGATATLSINSVTNSATAITGAYGEGGVISGSAHGIGKFDTISEVVFLPPGTATGYITCTISKSGYSTYVTGLPVARTNF